ncbi:hypothetical protein C8R44DRAFT_872220 [Mycena epipterygia]|nr:hypothetical protein C8R44DRAFT_872220 [Mycena epipterygia]
MASDFPGLDGTYGTLEIGVVIGTFLSGIETLQTFNYYRNFPKDSALLKAIVALVWLLALSQTICSLHANYLITVTYYGRSPYQVTATPPHSLVLAIFFTSLSNTVVQLFFGNRIRVISGKRCITIVCFVLNVTSLAGSLVLMANMWTSSDALTILRSRLEWELILFSALAPFVDFIIATSMCYHLWRLRQSEPRSERMRSTLDTLILWTAETTLLTSLAGIIQLVLFLVRTDLAFMVFYLIQSKLYSNSMLAVLNGRTRFRSHDQETADALAFDFPASRRTDSIFSHHVDNNRSVVVQMPQMSENVQDAGISKELEVKSESA